VEHETRDQVVDYVNYWVKNSDLAKNKIVKWIGIQRGKFYDWCDRFGKANEHNGLIPRDFWLTDFEKERVLKFHGLHPLEGYKRLTYLMLDKNIVAVSPATVYLILKRAGVLDNRKFKPSKKGTGFIQPLSAHEHWHCDVSYINIAGTFYYLCTLLDGYSRYVVHWDIKESMGESDIQLIIQQALEKYPGVKPRLISDRGPQFIAREFKSFIKQSGMSQVWTSPYYPQSNGKLERWHREVKTHCIRPKAPRSLREAKQQVSEYVDHYNNERLHAAIGYIAPKDKLAGREEAIFKERDEKLARARAERKKRRQQERNRDLAS
jgi:putative transposase